MIILRIMKMIISSFVNKKGGTNEHILGFKKPNYTDDKRINQLQTLYQFRNKTREEVQEYYYSIVKPKLLDGTKSEYHRRAARKSYKKKQLRTFILEVVLTFVNIFCVGINQRRMIRPRNS